MDDGPTTPILAKNFFGILSVGKTVSAGEELRVILWREVGWLCHFKRASLVVQLVKNPPAMRETWVRSLGWEDPLEQGKAAHSSILAWRIPWTV